METNSSKSKQRKAYTSEQKLKIVLESFQRDTTVEAVRIKYGVAASALHRTPVSWQAETNVVYRTARLGAGHFDAKAQRHDIAGIIELMQYSARPGFSQRFLNSGDARIGRYCCSVV